jgi:hypothetical protein
MKTRFHGLLVVAILVTPVGSKAHSAADPILRVEVDFRADSDLPSARVAAARTLAADVYREIGVEIDWVIGMGETGQDPPARGVWRRIVINPSAAEAFPQAVADMRVVGIAPRGPREPGRVAYVFYEAVVNAARRWGTPVSSMLGYTIVHELAHLLLPGEGHDNTGVMRKRWGLDDLHQIRRRALMFDEHERALIRGYLLSQTQP